MSGLAQNTEIQTAQHFKYTSTIMATILLIIDDEADICELLSRMLRPHFDSVAFRVDLAGAMQYVAEMRPSHILLDNNLPDGFGLDSIQAIRKIRPDTRVVVISAVDVAAAAIAAGADAFVSKPLQMALVKNSLGVG